MSLPPPPVPLAAGSSATLPSAATCARTIAALAALLASATVGESRLPGWWVPPSLDAVLSALGARIQRTEHQVLAVQGRGLGGLADPVMPLDLTGLTEPIPILGLLAGLLATQPLMAVLVPPPDQPLPHGLLEALDRIGARAFASDGGRCGPVTVVGTATPMPQDLCAADAPEISTSIALAVLAAGLNTPGDTRVPLPALLTEPLTTPLVALLGAFGVPVQVTPPIAETGPAWITISGEAETRPADLTGSVPGLALPSVPTEDFAAS